MKHVRNLLLTAQLGALLLIHTLPARAGVTVPFQGRFAGAETGVANFPTLDVTGEVTGQASHLGRFTMQYHVEVDLVTISSTGTAELIAANGDRLFADVVGQATVVGPDLFSIEEHYTITEGTGRFQGASGSFVLARSLIESTGVTAGSFSGTLVLAKAK